MTAQNVILVTFGGDSDSDTNAYPALTELKQLDWQDQVTIKAATVITREADGRVTVKSQVGSDPFEGTTTGGLMGLLIGVLGGPLGMLLGGTTGLLVGSLFDVDDAGDTLSVLDEISKHVEPSRTAVLAEVSEQSTEVIDTAMIRLGGTVVRWPVGDVIDELAAAEKASRKARQEARAELRQARLVKTKTDAHAKVEELKAKHHRNTTGTAA